MLSNHFTERAPAMPGTMTRTGKPCSGVSGWWFCWKARRMSASLSRARSSEMEEPYQLSSCVATEWQAKATCFLLLLLLRRCCVSSANRSPPKT